MSGLLNSLNQGVRALNATTRAVETAGRNLANVNNPDYARQRVVLGSRGTVQTPQGVVSLGLEVTGLTSFRDRLIDGRVQNAVSLSASFDAKRDLLEQAESGLGQGVSGKTGGIDTISANPGGATGLGESLDAFFNAFQSFSANPTSVIEKQQVYSKSQLLVGKMNTIDARLAQIATPASAATVNDLTRQLDDGVEAVNGVLGEIARLNSEIGRYEVGRPGSALDLRDQRQAQIEKLAEWIDFTVVQSEAGQVNIEVRDAIAANPPVVLVDRSTVLGVFHRDVAAFRFGATASPASGPTLALAGGRLKGLSDGGARVAALRGDLDALARQLVTSVNTAYAAIGNYFNPAGLTAGTIALDASLTVASLRPTSTANAGANEAALAIAQIGQTRFAPPADSINGTPAQHLARTVADLGQSLVVATDQAENEAALQKIVKAERDSLGGVSIDEETADMMRYQRAFQANARFINVIDEMLDAIVNRLLA